MAVGSGGRDCGGCGGVGGDIVTAGAVDIGGGGASDDGNGAFASNGKASMEVSQLNALAQGHNTMAAMTTWQDHGTTITWQ